MFEKLKMIFPLIMGRFLGVLGTKDVPIDATEKRLNFSAEELAKLQQVFGNDFTQKSIEAMNNELKAYVENDLSIKAMQDELDAKERERKALEERQNADANDAVLKELQANLLKKDELLAEQKKQIEQLAQEPFNAPLEIITQNNNRRHTATHVFGDNKVYNEIKGRNWNKRLVTGSHTTTDFISPKSAEQHIPLLQSDLEHYVRLNPTMLKSMFDDIVQLPSEWTTRTGVQDRIADGYFVADEIMQGRAEGWAPKNKFKFDIEEGQVYRKKIDITFTGHELQEYENTWVGEIYNGKDGSHPWKTTFVGFLLGELIIRQMNDERQSMINGIFAKSPKDVPGQAVHSQTGLRYLFYKHRDIEKKYRPTYLGPITSTNIVEKINQLIESIPETHRHNAGLELGISEANLLKYRKTAGKEYQLHRTPDTGNKMYDKLYPIDYPNIKFQPLRDLDNDFMYITYSKNIEVLKFIPAEETAFSLTREKRDTHLFADYRSGIRLAFVGTTTADTDLFKYEKQLVWTNEAPVLSPRFALPLFDDKTGVIDYNSKKYSGYNNLVIDENWTTDITSLVNFPKGILIKITGNQKLVTAKKLKAATGIDSDFDLSTGGTITIYSDATTGTFKEITRTNEPAILVNSSAEFSEDAFDAANYNEFKFVGTAATTLADIDGGVEGKQIKIWGSADGVLTVADVAGLINVGTSVVLADETKWVTLIFTAGQWYKAGSN